MGENTAILIKAVQEPVICSIKIEVFSIWMKRSDVFCKLLSGCVRYLSRE